MKNRAPEPCTPFECEDCIGMIEHGCYCAAMGATAPGGPAAPEPRPVTLEDISDEIEASEHEFRPMRSAALMNQLRDDMSMMDALEADGEKLRQLTGQDHGPVFLNDIDGDRCALMTTLRESLILERAKALHRVVCTSPADEAIEIIKLALRVERDEGIETGIRQAETHAELLEKAS